MNATEIANPYLEELRLRVAREPGWCGGEVWAISNLLAHMEMDEPLEVWRKNFVQRYAWAIPTHAAIKAIAALSPIVEMGAGTGYWAKLISEAGGDVVAYDLHPPTGSAPTSRSDNRPVREGKWHATEEAWFPVRRGQPSALQSHPDRTLLLVWPPYAEPMATQCLDHWTGKSLVFVGEGDGGCTADEAFFDRLRIEFDEVGDVEIEHWWGINDHMTIYQRREILHPTTR